MAALTEIFARFRTDVDTRPLQRGERAADRFGQGIKALGAAIATTFAVDRVASFVDGMVEGFSEIERTSQRLGLSTDAVQEFEFVAQAAGRQLEDFTDAFSTLQERARDALIDPRSDPAEQLRLLGVAATDAQGRLRSGEDLFLSVADGLQRMGNQTDRVGAVMTLFGDVGRELLPVLQDGSAGIEEMRQAFRDLGGGASTQAIESAIRTRDAMSRFGAAVTAVKGRLAEQFLPAIEGVVGFLARSVPKWQKASEGVDLFRAAAIVAVPVVVSLGLAVLSAVWPFLLVTSLMMGAALAVEDLIVAYEGGESAIRDFLLAHTEIDIVPILDRIADGAILVKAGAMAAMRGLGGLQMAVISLSNQALVPALEHIRMMISGLSDLIGLLPGGQAVARLLGGAEDIAASASRTAQAGADRFGRRAARAPGQVGRELGTGERQIFEETVRRTAERQQSAALRSSATTSETTTNNVNVNVNGTGNPEAVGQAVVDRISRELTGANEGG